VVRPYRLIAQATVAALVWTGVATAAGGHSGSSGARPRIVLDRPIPATVQVGERLTIAGHVRKGPRRARVALESSTGRHWQIKASTALKRGGAFTVRWLIPDRTETGPLKLRLILKKKSRLLANTPPAESAVGSSTGVGSSSGPCGTRPAVGSVPAGDGWIVGALFSEGGHPPGTPRCASESYSVTASNSAGMAVATQLVPAGDSYTLVVPAGDYTLRSGGCRGAAAVNAGQQTDANVDCLYP
jgi:hypothetical protein